MTEIVWSCFALATLFSIFSMILMVMLCAFFAEPWEMVELGNKMLSVFAFRSGSRVVVT